MGNFLTSFNLTMGNEGALSINKLDSGGKTYKGIAFNFWPSWGGWPKVDKALADANNNIQLANTYLGSDQTVQALVNQFYKVNFWNPYNLDIVTDQAICNEMFDTAVNMGVSIEGKFLQRALNVLNKNGTLYPDLVVDGIIGNRTIATLNAHPNKKQVLKVLNILQGARYIAIMEANPSQEAFANSWFSRVSI